VIESQTGGRSVQEDVIESQAGGPSVQEDVIESQAGGRSVQEDVIESQAGGPETREMTGVESRVSDSGEVTVHQIVTHGDTGDGEVQLVAQTGEPETGVRVSSEGATVEKDTTMHLIITQIREPDEGRLQNVPGTEELEKDQTAEELQTESMEVEPQTRPSQQDDGTFTGQDLIKK
jgi:hypothetical protein